MLMLRDAILIAASVAVTAVCLTTPPMDRIAQRWLHRAWPVADAVALHSLLMGAHRSLILTAAVRVGVFDALRAAEAEAEIRARVAPSSSRRAPFLGSLTRWWRKRPANASSCSGRRACDCTAEAASFTAHTLRRILGSRSGDEEDLFALLTALVELQLLVRTQTRTTRCAGSCTGTICSSCCSCHHGLYRYELSSTARRFLVSPQWPHLVRLPVTTTCGAGPAAAGVPCKTSTTATLETQRQHLAALVEKCPTGSSLSYLGGMGLVANNSQVVGGLARAANVFAERGRIRIHQAEIPTEGASNAPHEVPWDSVAWDGEPRAARRNTNVTTLATPATAPIGGDHAGACLTTMNATHEADVWAEFATHTADFFRKEAMTVARICLARAGDNDAAATTAPPLERAKACTSLHQPCLHIDVGCGSGVYSVEHARLLLATSTNGKRGTSVRESSDDGLLADSTATSRVGLTPDAVYLFLDQTVVTETLSAQLASASAASLQQNDAVRVDSNWGPFLPDAPAGIRTDRRCFVSQFSACDAVRDTSACYYADSALSVSEQDLVAAAQPSLQKGRASVDAVAFARSATGRAVAEAVIRAVKGGPHVGVAAESCDANATTPTELAVTIQLNSFLQHFDEPACRRVVAAIVRCVRDSFAAVAPSWDGGSCDPSAPASAASFAATPDASDNHHREAAARIAFTIAITELELPLPPHGGALASASATTAWVERRGFAGWAERVLGREAVPMAATFGVVLRSITDGGSVRGRGAYALMLRAIAQDELAPLISPRRLSGGALSAEGAGTTSGGSSRSRRGGDAQVLVTRHSHFPMPAATSVLTLTIPVGPA